MTVASETTVSGPYTLNGVTTVFAYGFRILQSSDLEFVKYDATTGALTVVSSSDYTVSGVGDAGGGNVTFSVAPASGSTGWARRKSAMTQLVALTDSGPFYPSVVMGMVDRLAMHVLEVREEARRSFRGTIGETVNPVSVQERKGKVLSFHATTGALEYTLEATDVSAVAAIADEIATLGALDTEISALYANLAVILDAEAQATAAAASAVAAAASAATAAGHVTTAAGHVTTASGHATTASNEADSAAASADAAAASASTASTQASAASSSASAASTSASTATTQAGIATTQAGNAATSAGNAATSASDADADRIAAAASASTATTQAGIATTQAGNASTSASAAATSASTASTAATAAQTAQADAEAAEATIEQAISGYTFAWDTGTTDADPGAGEIRANNATLSSATFLYVSETDSLGAAVAAAIATWDDSTSATRAFITLKKRAAPGNFAMYAINGAMTDAGAYRKVPVSYVTHAGSFSASDILGIIVERTGDTGPAGAGSGDMLIANALSELAGAAATARGNIAAAPNSPEYIVAASNSELTAERVVTNTATLAWDTGTAGQLKANIPDDAVTYAKLQNVTATNRILARFTAGAGDVEEASLGTGLSFVAGVLTMNVATALGYTPLNSATYTAADVLAKLLTVDGAASGLDADLLDGQSSAYYLSAANLNAGTLPAARMPALTGDVTTSAGAVATTIAANAVTFAKRAQIATDRLVGRDTAATGSEEALTVGGGIEFTGTGGIQRSALTGDVTASAGSNATTIAANAVTLAKMATMATDSILGRATAATGNVEVLAALPFAYTGDVTRAADSNTTVLAAGNAGNLNSGTLLAARMPALTGDITTSAGAVATTIQPAAITGRTEDTAPDPNADFALVWDASAAALKKVLLKNIKVQEAITIAVSDESTAITTGTAKVTFRMPYAFTLTAVRASLNTVSSSGIPTVDINEGGVSILSTKLTIDASEKTSTTAATAAVISDATLADDAEMTIDIDVAGTGAKGLKVILIGYRT
jgi:hypothetical protein